MVDDLIYDIGAHTGEDTEFYLGKGFRVVAVEANPVLADGLARRFPGEVSSGQLAIIQNAVAATAGESMAFFINQEKNDWSSLDAETASKGTMAIEEVEVRSTSLRELVDRFGTPYYLKVDIEGGDTEAARQLLFLDDLPQYASFELHDLRIAALLEAAGYREYQLRNQWLNGFREPVVPPREGTDFWPGAMTGFHSGHFGQELPENEWRGFVDLMRLYLAAQELIRTIELSNSWFDVHAKR